MHMCIVLVVGPEEQCLSDKMRTIFWEHSYVTCILAFCEIIGMKTIMIPAVTFCSRDGPFQ